MAAPGVDSWIECAACNKWRRVACGLADKFADESVKWNCSMNGDKKFADCSVPQELDNDQIDELMGAQADADAAAAGVNGAQPAEAPSEAPRADAPVWRLVHRNFFTHRPPKQVREEDVMMCSCEPGPDGTGCGDECLNRSLFYECDSRFCPCGTGCLNQRFQRRQYCDIEMRRAGRKGHGLFIKHAVPRGTFIIEYVGEVLEERAYAERKIAYAEAGQRHFYFMSLGGAEVIDACARGNLGRFVNHSCDPNCETQKWMVAGELCIGMFTTRDVRAGEELTFDYNFERYDEEPMRCLCGAKNCRGWVGGPGDGASAPRDGDEDEEEYEEDPEPLMLASDGAELAAFEQAAAAYAAAEVERSARRACERAERMARRKAAESRPRRASVTPGGAKARRGADGSSAPVPHVKRSEVQRRLDEILSPAGALKQKEAVPTLLRLFSVALAAGTGGGDAGTTPGGGPAQSGPTVSSRDLSLLLEAFVCTASPALQRALIECNCLSVMLCTLPRLAGTNFTSGPAVLLPVLRKMLRAIDGLPLSVGHLVNTRTVHGSLLAALQQLCRHADAEVSRRARDLLAKVAPSSGPGATPMSGIRPPDAPGRGSFGGTPMMPMASLQGMQRTPASAPHPQHGYSHTPHAMPPPGPPPPLPPPPAGMHWSAHGEDERSAKRARAWGPGTDSAPSSHHYPPPPPPLPPPPPPPPPRESYPPPPPLPPPPPTREMVGMDFAPVGSPSREHGAEARNGRTAAAGGGAHRGGVPGGVSSPVAAGGGGDVGSGGGPQPPPVYPLETVVPHPNKTDVMSLPAAWDDPFGHSFKMGVLVLVAYRLGKYLQDNHPLAKLVRSGADAMVLKLASKVVDRERRRAEEHRGRAPVAVARDKLSEKIRTFVSDHVHALEKAARAGMR